MPVCLLWEISTKGGCCSHQFSEGTIEGGLGDLMDSFWKWSSAWQNIAVIILFTWKEMQRSVTKAREVTAGHGSKLDVIEGTVATLVPPWAGNGDFISREDTDLGLLGNKDTLAPQCFVCTLHCGLGELPTPCHTHCWELSIPGREKDRRGSWLSGLDQHTHCGLFYLFHVSVHPSGKALT
jgi:hypothetical protein